MIIPEVPACEALFGRKTGRHTHPATHPVWMEFTEGICAGQRETARPAGRLARLLSRLL